MAQSPPPTNPPGSAGQPPSKRGVLRHLAHPHWNGVGAIATVIALIITIGGIVFGLIRGLNMGFR
jgi:hypothetical protein